MKFLKHFLMLIVVLASVLAVTYTDTVIFTNNNNEELDVGLFNCGSDTSCENPDLVDDYFKTIQADEYTFERETSEYYAEFFFKEGYAPKAYLVPVNYQGTDYVTFNKFENCDADILNADINEISVTEGENVVINVEVESAFTRDETNPILYEPSEYEDWYDADTEVRLIVLDSENNTVYEDVELRNIYRDETENVEFILNTSELTGDYNIVVETNVIDEICETQETQESNFDLTVNPLPQDLEAPIANFTYEFVDYSNVSFDASESFDIDGDIVSYEWDFGDGETGVGETINHVFGEGTYNVTLTVTDNDTLTDSMTREITITIEDENIVPSVEIVANPEEGEAPLTVNFSAIVEGDSPIEYEWDFDENGIVDSNEEEPSYEFEENGTYLVTLKITDADGEEAEDTIEILVGEKQEANEDNEHELLVDQILVPEDIYIGDEFSVDIELRNNGDYTEKDLLARVYVEELGLYEIITGFDLSPKSSKWKQVTFELPYGIEEGDYTLKVFFFNDDASDIAYKTFDVNLREEIIVESVENTTEKEQIDWLGILEIIFLGLLILAFLIGIAVLIYNLFNK